MGRAGAGRPKLFEVVEREVVAEDSVRLVLDGELGFEPGQFAMVWVPGVDEVPLSIVSGDPLEFLVLDVGEATGAMAELEPGDRLGVRGPFGSGFEPVDGEALLVGGGIGVAPLVALGEALDNFDAAVGAATASGLVAEERLGARVSTDDGSRGLHGFVTELAEEMGLEDYDAVYSCGPEVMMVKLAESCREAGVEGQFSTERYMKCGVGVCGSCCVDPTGERVCVEGPVFSEEELLEREFGSYERDGSGAREPL